MKKVFISFIVICFSFFGCKEYYQSTPDNITLTWAENPLNALSRTCTQTITWRTDMVETNGEVQYTDIKDSAKFETAVKANEDSSGIFKTNIGTWTIHTKTIKDLKPGKTYCYRVGSNNNWSSKSTFMTEPENMNCFKFLIFGDSQSGKPNNPDYGKFDTTIHKAYYANPDSRFFINMGDLVEVGGYYNHWNKWYDAVNGVINKISFMPVQGNHETYRDSTEKVTSKPIYFIRQFKLPQNGPDGLKGQAYSYNFGNVHIAVWDSQIDEEKFDSTIIMNEIKWLDNDLKNTDKKWRIVLFHKTPYYNKSIRSNDKLKAIIQPVIDKNHVDIVINGHDHGISWTYPIKDDKFVERPSQGTIYYITGRSGGKTYHDLSKKVWDAYFYDPKEQPNYIVAEVNDNKFKLTAFKQDGTAIDTCIIDKSKDEVIHGTVKVVVPEFKETNLVIYGGIDNYYKPVKIGSKWYIPSDFISSKLGYKIKESKNLLMISKD